MKQRLSEEARRFEFDASLDGVRLQTTYPLRGVHYHFHPEFELVLVQGGAGRYMVGNTAGTYSGRALILVGPHLAHGWTFDDAQANATIHAATFTRQSLGFELLSRPAFSGIDTLLSTAQQGLWFAGPEIDRLGTAIEKLQELHSARRLLQFLDILALLSEQKDATTILPPDYLSPRDAADHALFARILRYIHDRLGEQIAVADAADHLHMSVASFTRFFKRMTGITFVSYNNAWRIEQACILLRTTQRKVLDIAIEVGFGNLSNFNRCFRRSLGTTPREYRASPHS
jgi:AraC-like DNA-binding protein